MHLHSNLQETMYISCIFNNAALLWIFNKVNFLCLLKQNIRIPQTLYLVAYSSQTIEMLLLHYISFSFSQLLWMTWEHNGKRPCKVGKQTGLTAFQEQSLWLMNHDSWWDDITFPDRNFTLHWVHYFEVRLHWNIFQTTKKCKRKRNI